MFYLVIFIFGFVIAVIALCCIALCVKERFYIELYMSIAFFAVGVIMAICGATSFNRIYHKPKETFIAPIEYPASEYELKLRIVEFEGRRDTTYVLVEKIKEYEI